MSGLLHDLAISDRDAAIVAALQETRERTFALVASLSDAQLEHTYSTLMSPLAWDLAHIAAYEDLWLSHRYGGRPLLRADLAEIYDALETPRADRGQIELLGAQAAREYMQEVRDRTLDVTEQQGTGDGLLHELVIRHEQQHNETMLQAIVLARLAGYEPARDARRDAVDRDRMDDHHGARHTGLELIEIPAGECLIGADREGFAYDNERPRHSCELGPFAIGATPVTNATYLAFVDDGGYARRQWWSDAGWAWRRQHAITRPGAWSEDHRSEWRLDGQAPLDPDAAVTSISWFEADAFARAHRARLPSEREWEKAARWDPGAGAPRSFPWGESPPIAGLHANLDHVAAGPQRVGSHPAGASAAGALDLIGNVWEWTASDFTGYEGFVAKPYREYSEVFFGSSYKVLRGGSWATRARLITPSFRNWDLPQRRQIFAGVRIARDA